MKQYLDFEEDIIQLEDKITELEQISQSQGIQVKEEVEQLKEKSIQQTKEIFSHLTPFQRVQLARHSMRPYTEDIIEALSKDFVELHGDRHNGDDPAVVTGFGTIANHTFCIIGHRKGREVQNRLKCHFGMAHPEGYRKADRICKIAESRNIPIIHFIDTPGAYPGIEAEERGQSSAIAESILLRTDIKVPTISIVIGEGGSGGALAFGVADTIAMMQYAYYSVISPEGCASILWKDTSKIEEAAQLLKLLPEYHLENKIIDSIIPEPLGGAHRNWSETFRYIEDFINKTITRLNQCDSQERLQERLQKIRKIGHVKE